MEVFPTFHGALLLKYNGDDYIISWTYRSISLSTVNASKEKTTLTINSSIVSSDDGKYFVMADTVGNNYVVYIAYDSDSDGLPDSNGSVPNPGLNNQIMVPVVVQANSATISDVVADLVSTINNLDNFAATDSDPDVVIENINPGKVHTPAFDDNGNTNWTITRSKVGYNKGEVIKDDFFWMTNAEVYTVEAAMNGDVLDLTVIVKKKAYTIYINKDRPSQKKKESYMLDKQNKKNWFTFLDSGSSSGSSSESTLDCSDISLNYIPHNQGSEAYLSVAINNGKAIFAPFQADNIIIFDMATETITATIPHNQGSNAYFGVAIDNGKAIFAPREADDIIILDIASETITTIPHGQGSIAYWDVAIDNGKAVFVPSNASDIIIFDMTTETITATIPHNQGSEAFTGVAIDNGKAIFAPARADNIIILDIASETITTIPHNQGDNAYWAVAIDNGKAVFAPAGVDDIIILDIASETITATIPHGQQGLIFYIGIVIENGKAVFSPVDANDITILDIATETVCTISHNQGNGAFREVAIDNGKAVFSPYKADDIVIGDLSNFG